MKIFVTGANGFIGGAVATRLVKEGHTVRGLVRDAEKARGLGEIEPVVGNLDDADLLKREAARADAVVNAASSDHAGAIDAFLSALRGSGKVFLHTSGSSIVADDAMGDASEAIFHEGVPFDAAPDKRARMAIDRKVVEAEGVRAIVLCNTMIYGDGVNGAESVQIPVLAAEAQRGGVARFIGRGENRWSNVHVDDVADLYALALAKGKAGSFVYVESGEESLGNIVRAIAKKRGIRAESWSRAEAISAWGREMAVFALGSNSRVRGKLASELGWSPRRRSVLEWITETASI